MRSRATRRAVVALALVQVVVASTVVGYRAMTASPEASVDAALEEYRLQQTTDTPASDLPGQPEAAAETAAAAGPAPTPAADSPALAAADPTAPQQAPPAEPTEPGKPLMTAPPDPGVYEWKTDGWEQAAGIRRDFPERSVRIVTLEGPKRWMNEHRYSENHVQWFPLEITDDGIYCERYQNRVRFGPLSGESAVAYDPPALFTMQPLEVGYAWTGSWEGDTRGTYEGRIFERTTMRVGNEDVDVWGSELRMKMEGEFTGTVESRIWTSPKYRLTVKESYDQEVSGSQGTYRAEWTITLISPRPQR